VNTTIKLRSHGFVFLLSGKNSTFEKIEKKEDMKTAWLILAALSMLISCAQNTGEKPEKSVEEIMTSSEISNSSIIRNPVSATEPEDTVNVPEITFEETTFDFGEVTEGETVEHVYRFTNTGKAPLLIGGARSTCGCTVPEWPEEPILPGESGEITVRFNTNNKRNKQTKPITIVANTYPANERIYLTGFVRPAEETQ
jgi:hypothetical protein